MNKLLYKLSALKEDVEVIENKFNGKSMAFIGTTDFSKNTLLRLAREYGANPQSTLSDEVDVIVLGKCTPTMTRKVNDINKETMTIDEFMIAIGKKIV